MNLGKSMAAVALALLLYGCDKIKDKYIEHELKDRSDYSLLEDTGAVRIILCGTGSPQVNAPRGQACTLIAAGGRLFLFDAGENAMRNIERNLVPLSELQRVFITHWHSDHFNGLGALINHTWIYGRKNPFNVYGPGDVESVMQGFALVYADDVRYRNEDFVSAPEAAFGQAHPFTIPNGQESLRVYDEDGITIDAYRVDHTPVEPAVGYLLSYRGKKIFVSGDTRISPRYRQALENADVVIHEAINSDLVKSAADVASKLGRTEDANLMNHVIDYHADTLQVAQLADSAKVKHLVLTHLIPAPTNFINRYLFTKGMSEFYGGEITIAEDGMEIALP